jgi:hypothetical protein
MDLFWGMSAALVKALPLYVVRVPPRFIFLIYIADPRTDLADRERTVSLNETGIGVLVGNTRIVERSWSSGFLRFFIATPDCAERFRPKL